VLTARRVLAEAQAGDGEDQVAYRAGARHVPRLERRTPAWGSAVLGSDTSHLVIGATGHIGPHLIQQLADMGAGTIVAVSRNPGVRLNDLARRLSSTGTTLVVVAADATDETAMSALFDQFGTELPAVEGIYLAAFAGGPVALSDMTDDDVNSMFRPKLDALGVLHALSLRTAVQQFVLFSSISGRSVRGGLPTTRRPVPSSTPSPTPPQPGPSGHRRELGIVEIAGRPAIRHERVMSTQGSRRCRQVAIRALPVVTGPDAPVRSTVVDADWPLLAAAYRTRGALRIVDDLLADDDATDQVIPESEFRKALRECSPERRRELLAEHIGTLASDVMGLAPTEILDPAAGFFQLGMDSLMSVTLQRSLSASLGITLPAAVIYEYPTISCLTDALCERMGYATAAEIPGDSSIRRGAEPSNALGPPGSSGEQTERTWGRWPTITRPRRTSATQRDCGYRNGGPFPGADSVTTFWDNLRRGEVHRHASRRHLPPPGVSTKTLADPAYVRRAPLLDGIEFDAEYFGMTPYTPLG
jgi:phthiocerol/phenolphthiocerol synthesis type-I polyketide synthase B